MKKISDIKNEEALDVLAEIIEPTALIMADPAIRDMARTQNKMGAIKVILKNHKSEIIQILASLDGVPVEEYECNILTLPVKIIEILNDKDLMSFFTSQEWTEEKTASTSPTANTEAKGR